MPRLLLLLILSVAAAPLGPRFREGGPDAAKYGQAEHYPIGPKDFANDPEHQKHVVGADSHFDQIFPTHTVARPKRTWSFKRAATSAAVAHEIDDFLDHQPVTGLIVVRDDTILSETYQYARSDRDRFVAYSMTKTLISLLMGIARAEHRIASLDDPAPKYVPALAGSAYAETSLHSLLLMSSGVELSEETFWNDLFTAGEDTGKSLAKDAKRVAASGATFKYSTGDSEVLTTVLRKAAGQPLARYLSEKIWQPIGAESDATWGADSSEQEIGPWGFSATMRDYARLGRLLAHDGAWNGKTVIPKEWMIEATTLHDSDPQVAPGRAAHYYGYGYQLWILPGDRRMFALIGAEGQYLFVDPKSKLVMVQTAVRLDHENVVSPRSATLAL